MTTPMSEMWMIAEPRNQFRERYRSEITAHNKSQRFLQASENSGSLSHPTIGFSLDIKPEDLPNWFIRVTLVTVKSRLLPHEYIHPYRITSEDEKVIKRPLENALYFPINSDDLINGRKSFPIIHYKLTQNELKGVKVLKRLNSTQQHFIDEESFKEPKRIIDCYQLQQSQLVFTLAQLSSKTGNLIIRTRHQILSRVMNGACSVLKESVVNFIYEPQQGSWFGGDRMLLYVDSLSKKRAVQVLFYVEETRLSQIVTPTFLDRKTIVFLTPPCPVPPAKATNSFEVQVIIKVGRKEIARGPFVYRKESLMNIEQKLHEFCERSLSKDQKHIKMEFGSRNDQTETTALPVQRFLEAPLFLPQISSTSEVSSRAMETGYSDAEFTYEVQLHENEMLEL